VRPVDAAQAALGVRVERGGAEQGRAEQGGAERGGAEQGARETDLDPLDSRAARLARRVAGAVITGGVHALARLDTSDLPGGRLPDDLGRRPLLVTNHRSSLDWCVVVALCHATGRWPSMFAREQFFDRPLRRRVLRLLALVPASRGRGAPAGLRRAERVLDSGSVLAIAAEGRLVRPEERPDGVGALRGGAGRLAVAGADVTVLTITGAEDVWPVGRSRPLLHRRRPRVVVRARALPVRPDERPSEVGARMRGCMLDLIGAPDEGVGRVDG
jgi:1-acyl-sn-glycerol-3-phosphate acyltransferase